MPLPKPRKGEGLNEFVGRCVIDPTMTSEFPNKDQRLAVCNNLFEQSDKTLSKAFGDKYRDAFERQRQITESRNIRNVQSIYFNEYNKAITEFLRSGTINQAIVFQDDVLVMMYVNLFLDTGLHFANWYYNTFEILITKAERRSPLIYNRQWELQFTHYAKEVAGINIRLLKGTALDTLKNITAKLLQDPEFQRMGAIEQGRVLRSRFKMISMYQAERIVRTETTTIANYATEQSALTVFPKEQLMKRWSTSVDGREREWHRVANGQERDYSQPFDVGGEPLHRAGEGSGRNRINCRCATIWIPKASSLG